MTDLTLFWSSAVAIITMQINDLIRGPWFFMDIFGLLFWNSIFLSAVFIIVKEYDNRERGDFCV